MRVLVTGAGGFLGLAVVERFLVHGVNDLRCLIRRTGSKSDIESIAARFPSANIEIVVANLLDVDVASRILHEMDIVCHLAASMKGSPGDMFLNTVVASKNLLEGIADVGVGKVVLISSFGVYGIHKLRRETVVNENTPIEEYPGRRDAYSHAKWRQEQLFHEYQSKLGFPLVVLRPGVIYGPKGPPMSARVGLNVFGLFLHLGRNNILPLTYVDNCAEAVVLASLDKASGGEVYNVHDDDLPTAHAYLSGFRRNVNRIRYITIPCWVTRLMSVAVEDYHRRSKGQMPDIFTPYKTSNIWKGMRFDNTKLKRMGWRQLVPTHEGLERAFVWLRENTEQ